MAFFKTLDINMKVEKGGLNEIRDSVPILTEGVYYTYFIYEEVPASDNGQSQNDEDINDNKD